MISPTPGRIVWYHPTASDPCGQQLDPLAAIVAQALSDKFVNLLVVGPIGLTFVRLAVPLAQDDEPVTVGMAQWMPYQTAQAAKYEAKGGLADRITELEGAASIVKNRLHDRVSELEAAVRGLLTPASPPPSTEPNPEPAPADPAEFEIPPAE